MKNVQRIVIFGASVVGLLAMVSCKTTVVDVSTTTTTIVGETTTLPAGTPAELLPKLRDLAFTLSSAIVARSGNATMTELNNLWSAIRAQMPRTGFVDSAAHQMELMQTAVERRRPADADKAALHLQALVDANLGATTGP